MRVAAAHRVAEGKEDAADDQDAEKDAEQRADAQSQVGIRLGFFAVILFKERVHKCSSGFGGGGVGLTPGPVTLPATVLLNNEISSMGRGKTMVVFFSVPMSVRVWRYRSCMVMGCVESRAAASTRRWEAANSPSALMILERFSRSASACLAMARSMDSGRSTCLTSVLVTFTPQGAVCLSRISWMRELSASRWLSNWSSSTSPRTERRVVCANCEVW